MSWSQVAWKFATGPLFALALGVLYLFGKIVARHVIHALATYDYDIWAAMAWLGVDLAILSWSVAIGAQIDQRLAFNRPQTVMFFILLAGSTLMASASYGFFVKRRKIINGLAAVKDLKLAWWLTCSWFFGLLQFVPIVRGLLRALPP